MNYGADGKLGPKRHDSKTCDTKKKGDTSSNKLDVGERCYATWYSMSYDINTLETSSLTRLLSFLGSVDATRNRFL